MEKTEEKSLLNLLRIETLEKGNKQEIKKAIGILRKKFKYSYKILSSKTGIPKATLHNWYTGGLKNDNWQKTTRLVLKGLDLERLIQHFQQFRPSEEDKLKIKRLITALYECLRR